jgi:LCP family protein required for cell wall assembly
VNQRDPRRGRPTVGRYGAAFVSALVPGLGHLVAGEPRLGLLFLLPVLVAVASGAAWLVGSPLHAVATLTDPSVIGVLLVAQGVLLVWRLMAVASHLRGGRSLGRGDLPLLALLLAVVVLPQLYLGYLTEVARETATEVFRPDQGAWRPSTPPVSPPAIASPTPGLSPVGSPSPTPAEGRITALLIGVDAGVGRSTYLTDTLIVASVDPVGKTVSLLSIPRDMVDVPLPDGRSYAGKINSLLSYARRNPDAFPGSSGSGIDVLMAAIGTLVGLPIDLYGLVDLGGFVTVVDAVGGVDVHVAHAFCDPTYDQYGFPHGFSITAGWHHLDGLEALAYARVRKAAGESDFTRAARQQEILAGLRDAVVRGGFLRDPVGLLRALGKTVQTNLPPALVPRLVDLAATIDRSRVYRAVIDHPLVRSGFDARGSIQIPDLAGIRALAARLFPPPGSSPDPTLAAAPTGGPVEPPAGGAPSSGVGDCRAAPRPATPTPGPSGEGPGPSGEGSPGATPEPSGSAGPAGPSPSESLAPSPTAPAASPTGTPLPAGSPTGTPEATASPTPMASPSLTPSP